MEQIQLSPSKLSLLNECQHCFWMQEKKGIKRPRGAFPSLPGGMDSVLKKYFDSHRADPIESLDIPGLKGQLFHDQKTLRAWRSWRQGLSCELPELGIRLVGALDDCLIIDGKYCPLDYKTRGWAPKSDGSEYYQTQLDCYALMLEHNNYPTNGKGYLLYFWPDFVSHGGIVSFNKQLFELQCNPEAAVDTLKLAALVLEGPEPEPNPDCEYCKYVQGFIQSV